MTIRAVTGHEPPRDVAECLYVLDYLMMREDLNAQAADNMNVFFPVEIIPFENYLYYKGERIDSQLRNVYVSRRR